MWLQTGRGETGVRVEKTDTVTGIPFPIQLKTGRIQFSSAKLNVKVSNRQIKSTAAMQESIVLARVDGIAWRW